jgi:hypothetical protein
MLIATSAAACEITIDYVITQKTYDHINDTISVCKGRPIIVRANSEGGLANPLIPTMTNIRTHGNVTWIVEESDVCISACAWLGIAATNRRGKFLFHGVTTQDGKMSNENIKLQGWLYGHGVGFEVSKQLITRDLVEIEFK